ncbi:MAG: hypothetical protein QNI91_14145 [Arenicellales bacterium]|nr:hypothetical protein [Arenicellales bacterium]
MGTSVTINTLTTDTACTGGIRVFGNPTICENTTTSRDTGNRMGGISALADISGLGMALETDIAASLATTDTEAGKAAPLSV